MDAWIRSQPLCDAAALARSRPRVPGYAPRVEHAIATHERAAFDAGYFALLERCEDEHYWFRARGEVIAAAVRTVVRRFAAGYGVLEVGCGTGNVLRVLESVCVDGSVSGLELLAEGAEIARRRVRCPVLVGTLDSIRAHEHFQLVCAFDVVEHTDDDVAFIAGMRDLLTENGRVMVTVPADPRLWSHFDVASGHRRRYTRATLQRAFTAAGMHVEYLTPFMSPLHPLALVARRRNHRDGDDHETIAGELRVPRRPLNAVAYRVLATEAQLVRRRRHLPFGTSLLAVAAPLPTARA